MRLVTVGVGAMNSPRYGPAGLLIAHRGTRVMLDGGPGAEPGGRLDAWLVCDDHAELAGELRALAGVHGLSGSVGSFHGRELAVQPRPVVHTSHPTFGYELQTAGRPVVWAPEFWEFPSWAQGADLMFAEAAGWDRPIRFAGRVGGHLDLVHVAEAAQGGVPPDQAPSAVHRLRIPLPSAPCGAGPMALPASSGRREGGLGGGSGPRGGTDAHTGRRPPAGRAPQAAGHQAAATPQAPAVAAAVQQEVTGRHLAPAVSAGGRGRGCRR